MNEFVEELWTVPGLLAVVSVLGMGAYLWRKRLYTLWQLRTYMLWPRLIFEYRDHTKKHNGLVGPWYHVAKWSFAALFAQILYLFITHISELPGTIVLVIVITAVVLVPTLGYAIYLLSKEHYY